jgi:hypothetical protein
MGETVTETIERAEREGLFVWYASKAYSPREIRRIIKNGFTVDYLATIDPVQTAFEYDDEARRYEDRTRYAREEAARIRYEIRRRNKVAA